MNKVVTSIITIQHDLFLKWRIILHCQVALNEVLPSILIFSILHFDLSFLQDLRNVPWDTAYIYDNVDDLWDHWATLFNEILDNHAPIKKKQIRGDQLPWITPEIQCEILWRNHLFKLHARNPTETSWNDYRKQRNRVTSLKRRGMKIFCMDASINSKHHGKFWSKMKPLLPSKGKKQSKIILLEDKSLVTDTNNLQQLLQWSGGNWGDG